MADLAHGSDEKTTPAGGEKDMTRGQFLTGATVGVGAVMGALLAVPVAGMALAPVFGGNEFEDVFIGNVDEFKDGEFIKVILRPGSDKPDAYVRKKVAFVRHNKDPKADTLAPEGQGEFTVVSNTCMHLGCPVQAAATGFVCPCHGGAYNKDGKRIAGPPVRPLDRYKWERRGDELWAVGMYSLTNNGKVTKLRGPGQHTSGPEKWFYPIVP